MQEAEFSPATRELLRAAGWHEGRHVDTLHAERSLVEHGFTVFPVVRSLLSEFAGLTVHHPTRVSGVQSFFHFDVELACQHVDRELVDMWDRLAEVPLCLIGESARNHQGLVMSAGGVVLAGTEDSLALVGESGRDAIEALCTGRSVAVLR